MSSQGTAIAGGAIAAALLDLLVEKSLITKADANIVIQRAGARLVVFSPQDQSAAQDVLSSIASLIITRRE